MTKGKVIDFMATLSGNYAKVQQANGFSPWVANENFKMGDLVEIYYREDGTPTKAIVNGVVKTLSI